MKNILAILALACFSLYAQTPEPVVTTVNVSLALTQEQSDALDKRVADLNAKNAALTPPVAAITKQEFLANALLSATNSWVREDYEAAVKGLGEAAKVMPYAERKALIEQVKQAAGGE